MHGSDLKMQKAHARKYALQARNALPEAYRLQAAQKLGDLLCGGLTLPDKCVVSGFWPIRTEIDPRSLMQRLESQGKKLCLPVVLDAQTIEFRMVSLAGDRVSDLVETGFGTYGPGPDAAVVDPDVLLVPLAAFDAFGNRIGYGAGYYDRAIAALHDKNKVPVLIGVAFDAQRVDQISHEPHDVALNYILTETGLTPALQTSDK